MAHIFLKIGSVTIFSFGFFIFLTIFLALFFVWREARGRGLAEEKVLDAYVLALLGLVASGRIIYVATHWGFFQPDWSRIFLVLKYPGFSFFWGLVAGTFLGSLAGLLSQISFWEMLDLFSLSLAPALILSFAGCYITDCTSAKNFPAILVFSGVILTSILIWLKRQLSHNLKFAIWQKRPGLIFLCYLIFSSLSLLIASGHYSQGANVIYLLILLGAISLTLIRYREIFTLWSNFPAKFLGKSENTSKTAE